MNTKRRAHCQLWHDWKERIIRIGDEQTSLQNQFDNFRNEYGDYPALIEGLETTVNGFDGRLIIAESDIADAENRISTCENDIDNLEAEVDALDGRVTITESDISAAENRISACESDIESLETEVDALDGRISITETDITAVETRITACESDIDSLESEVNSLDGRVTITESDIADAEDRISACENDIDRIDAELVDKTGEINNLANRMSLAEADIDNLDARLEGIETGEILLSQLNVDSDKDWQGRTINNLNLNNVTYGNYHINPRFLTGDGLIFDGQPGFMNRDLKTYGSPQYIEVDGAPHPVALTKTAWFGIGHHTNQEKLVRVSPGDSITLRATCRTLIDSPTNGSVGLFIQPYDKNKEFVMEVRPDATRTIINDGIWREYEISWVVPDGIYYVSPYLYFNEGRPDATTEICDLKIYKDFNRDISAKVATFDGVIIRDGGTVDGVDISTHTHDGTAIGGPKISYNDLVDKPTIPDGSISTFASSNYKYFHDEEVQVSSTTLTKVKTFTFSKAGVTNARVYFELKGPAGSTGFAEVRKNGILIGSRQSQFGLDYEAKTQDLDLNISEGDTIELWCRTASTTSPAGVRNFRIGYDLGMEGSVTIS